MICSGYYSAKFEDEKPSFNTTIVIAGGSFLIHVILTIAISVTDSKWKKIPASKTSSSSISNRNSGINLGDMKSSWVVYVLVIGGSVVFTKMNKTPPSLLVTYPHNILVFVVQIIAPVIYASTLCLLFFPRHQQLRKSVAEQLNLIKK